MLGMGGGGRKEGGKSRCIDGVAEDTGMNSYQIVEAAKDQKGWTSILLFWL